MKLMQYKIREGSSLITTVLVMGVLMTLTLGLSSLVIREIRQTSSIVRAGQAYYNAEAGVENALLDLQNSLPGYETPKNGDVGIISGFYSTINQKMGNTDFQYQIRNRGDRYPYFDDNAPVFVKPGFAVPKAVLYKDYPEKTYNVLPLNQTVTIPLFVDCGGGTVSDVEDFLLEYYVDFKIDPDITLFGGASNIQLSKFDILRWKLYGEPMDTPGKTDAISDFYPAHDNNSPGQPVCIGTELGIDPFANCIIPVAQAIKEIKKITFIKTLEIGTPPTDSNSNSNPDDVKYLEMAFDDQTFDSWSMARECYKNEAGVNVTGSADIKKGCTIRNFVDSHTKNYLTLTNVINPGIIGVDNPNLRNSKAKIYYRLAAEGATACHRPDSTGGSEAEASAGPATKTPLPREYAEISADGFASGGAVKQSIDVRLKLNSFLPVFNFSLYRTDVGKDTPGQ